MSRAYDNAADGRYQQGGRRNLIINGNFNVAQRGTSSSTNGYSSLDRWTWSGTGTLSQETFTVGQTDVPGEPEKYLKFAITTGAANTRLEQRIEDVRTTAGQTFTISFYAKGTNPAGGEIDIQCEQRFGSGGSNEVVLTTQAFALTSSWTKYALTFTAPSISGKTLGTGNYFRVRIQQPSDDSGTAAWELNMSQFQAELGNIATPFEHRSYGEELALCKRYYRNLGKGFGGDVAGSTFFELFTTFDIEMRTTPSVALLTSTPSITEVGAGGRTGSGSTISGSVLSSDSVTVAINGFSGMTTSNGAYSTTASLISCDAEL